jgi:hypothetical protein
LAEDLKNWLELSGFETAISNAKNQLALLNMVLENQKGAIAKSLYEIRLTLL